MTPQALRESIYRRAFVGKLVEHYTEDGTAEETLKCIKYKTIKSLDDCADIPETWRWTYLIDIADILYGFPFNSEKFNETCIGMPIIRIRDINNGYSKTFSDEPCEERYRITKGDMLVGMDGNFQVAFWASEDAWLNQRVCKITTNPQVLIQKYLYYYLPIILKEINGTVSYSTVKHLSAKILNQMLIPLPPLAEQKRIVTKIEELLPYIDRYEKAWGRLEYFNKLFPVDMQKSILQMAIQGKLVERRPEEGAGEELYQQIQAEKQKLIKEGKIKKEKPLPEISEDEIPFDIPESWKWVRWGDISHSIQYGYNAPAQESGRIKMVRISDIQDGKVLWDSVPYCEIKEDDIHTYLLGANDILFARTGGTVGKSYLVKEVPEEAIYAGYLIRTQYSSLLCPEYMKCFMESQLYWDQLRNGTIATAQPNCNGKTLSKMILPLPPLAEQKRIVAKLEEILPLCERLK